MVVAPEQPEDDIWPDGNCETCRNWQKAPDNRLALGSCSILCLRGNLVQIRNGMPDEKPFITPANWGCTLWR